MTSAEFAIYGVSLRTPDDWTVELNPKSDRQKCDIAFHTKDGTKFYLSWGMLEEAQKRFKSLDEHVDFSIKQVEKGRDVDRLQTVDKREGEVNGHRSLYAKVSVIVRSGFMGRTAAKRTFLSTHFYCPQTSRFYVVYMLSGTTPINEDSMSAVYAGVINSLKCHGQAGSVPVTT